MGVFDFLKRKSTFVTLRESNRILIGSDDKLTDYDVSDGLINGYAKNPLINQVINKIASTVAGLPIKYNSSEVEKLLNKPNKTDFKSDFIEKIVISLLSTGSAFLYSEDYISGTPKEMRVLKTQYLEPRYDQYNEVYLLDYDFGNGYTAQIMPNEILQIKFPNIIDNGSESYWGVSPIRALKSTYDASNDVFTAQKHLFKNKGAVGFISSADSNLPLTPNEKMAIDNSLKERIGGADRYGKVITLDTPTSYTDIGKSPKDLMLGESNKDFLRIICSSFGVDSALFNDPDNKTYSNRKEAKVDYYNDVIVPLTNKIFSAMNYTYGWSIEIDIAEIETLNPNDESEKGI